MTVTYGTSAGRVRCESCGTELGSLPGAAGPDRSGLTDRQAAILAVEADAFELAAEIRLQSIIHAWRERPAAPGGWYFHALPREALEGPGSAADPADG